MKVIAIYSGGLDSTVLLCELLDSDHDIRALGINYGQRHVRELDAAHRICELLGIPFQIADISHLRPFLQGSSQTSHDIAVPEGHYQQENMKTTVVPNRNMLMLSIAGAWAMSTKSDAIAYAAHAGDHHIYWDCRPTFTHLISGLLSLADPPVQLLRPYIHMTKADIVKRGESLGVPFYMTWSCYRGIEVHCGRCATCVERQEAFEIADVEDPTEYADSTYWREVVGNATRREM